MPVELTHLRSAGSMLGAAAPVPEQRRALPGSCHGPPICPPTSSVSGAGRSNPSSSCGTSSPSSGAACARAVGWPVARAIMARRRLSRSAMKPAKSSERRSAGSIAWLARSSSSAAGAMGGAPLSRLEPGQIDRGRDPAEYALDTAPVGGSDGAQVPAVALVKPAANWRTEEGYPVGCEGALLL